MLLNKVFGAVQTLHAPVFLNHFPCHLIILLHVYENVQIGGVTQTKHVYIHTHTHLEEERPDERTHTRGNWTQWNCPYPV